MKIINCGRVVYILCGDYVATIVYDYNNGQSSATIYYENEPGEIIEAENGQTMRYAIMFARSTIRIKAYLSKQERRH